MPIYEYICLKCHHKFEYVVMPGKEVKIICPKCQSSEVKKLVSAFGIGGGASRIKNSGGVFFLFLFQLFYLPLIFFS